MLGAGECSELAAASVGDAVSSCVKIMSAVPTRAAPASAPPATIAGNFNAAQRLATGGNSVGGAGGTAAASIGAPGVAAGGSVNAASASSNVALCAGDDSVLTTTAGAGVMELAVGAGGEAISANDSGASNIDAAAAAAAALVLVSGAGGAERGDGGAGDSIAGLDFAAGTYPGGAAICTIMLQRGQAMI